MTKNWYAGYNRYGSEFSFDSGGWAIWAFPTRQDRDEWVKIDPAHRQPLSYKVVRTFVSDIDAALYFANNIPHLQSGSGRLIW